MGSATSRRHARTSGDLRIRERAGGMATNGDISQIIEAALDRGLKPVFAALEDMKRQINTMTPRETYDGEIHRVKNLLASHGLRLDRTDEWRNDLTTQRATLTEEYRGFEREMRARVKGLEDQPARAGEKRRGDVLLMCTVIGSIVAVSTCGSGLLGIAVTVWLHFVR